MSRLRHSIVAGLALLMSVPAVRAQLSTVVVVNFERAVVESDEGKKASDKFNATLKTKQDEVEKKQKELEDAQKKLQSGARTLSDATKADLQRDIERRTTELQRLDQDVQRELQALRDDLLRPIAERATAILNAMAAESSYTLVIDASNADSNVVWVNPKNDITDELVKRINAAPPASSAPKPAAGPPRQAPAPPKPTPKPQ
jgi:outer membrane protein